MPVAPAHQINEKTKNDENYDQKLNDIFALLYELLVDRLVLLVVSVTVLPERVIEDRVDNSSDVYVDVDQPCFCAQAELNFLQLVVVLSIRLKCFLENQLQKPESSHYS